MVEEYLLIGVGERFDNPDGSGRQDELKRCGVGEPVQLIREPSNPRDRNAIAILSVRGVQVGYVGRKDAEWLAPLIDAGGTVSASVHGIAPKGRPFAPLALTMKVRAEQGSSSAS